MRGGGKGGREGEEGVGKAEGERAARRTEVVVRVRTTGVEGEKAAENGLGGRMLPSADEQRGWGPLRPSRRGGDASVTEARGGGKGNGNGEKGGKGGARDERAEGEDRLARKATHKNRP